VRLTGRTGTKVGLSDPVALCGRAIAQRIKGTPGRAWNFVSAVNAGARRGLQAALIGPYGRIMTVVYR